MKLQSRRKNLAASEIASAEGNVRIKGRKIKSTEMRNEKRFKKWNEKEEERER